MATDLAVEPTVHRTSIPVPTLMPSGTRRPSRFVLSSPGPVVEGARLTVDYAWVGPGDASWFQAYVTLASVDSCVDGPLLYSQYLEGEPWVVDHDEDPWYAGARPGELEIQVDPPLLPSRFRLCIATWGGGERVWEEFYFDWLP